MKTRFFGAFVFFILVVSSPSLAFGSMLNFDGAFLSEYLQLGRGLSVSQQVSDHFAGCDYTGTLPVDAYETPHGVIEAVVRCSRLKSPIESIIFVFGKGSSQDFYVFDFLNHFERLVQVKVHSGNMDVKDLTKKAVVDQELTVLMPLPAVLFSIDSPDDIVQFEIHTATP
ncbi:MAG: hypothetical protein AAF203_01830 [Pseudomonadota bacterium]